MKNLKNSILVLSICTCLIHVASGQPIKTEWYYGLGDNVYRETEYSTDLWDAAIIGFNANSGDINENGNVNPIQIFMDKNETTKRWHIRADFASHGPHENWNVNVMFIAKGLVKTPDMMDWTGHRRWYANKNYTLMGSGNFSFDFQDADGADHWDVWDPDHGDIFTVRNNGNVGIGNNNPRSKLSFGLNLDDKLLGLWDNPDDFYGLGMAPSLMKLQVGSDAASFGFFAGDDQQIVSIKGDGNVGIGTTTPSARLHVNGGIKIGNTFDPNPTYFANDAYIAFGHPGFSEDFIGYKNNTFYLKDSDGGADTTDPDLIVGGKVGIGVDAAPTHELQVNGVAYATSFVTSAASFPDYVFREGYDLMPLGQLESFVKTNHHLPNMPSEEEVVNQGMNLNQVVTQSVENIESIYLHLIRLEKEFKALKKENQELKRALETRK